MIELNVDGAKKKIEKDTGVSLDFWQEIYWQNNSIQIDNPKEIKKKLDDDISAKLKILYDLALQPEKFEIKVEGNKDLERDIDIEIKGHIARGEQRAADYIKENRQEALEHYAKAYGKKQFEEYKYLVTLIQGSNYPDSFKVLILNEALNFVYRTIQKDGQEVLKVEKRKLNQSIFGLPNFPDAVLKYIFENGQKNSSFKELYASAQKEFLKEISKSSKVSFEKLDTFGKGEWLIFRSKKSDPEHFFENVTKLKALVQETSWCTKTLASTQLDAGDFYVFVDKNIKPHIAVRLVRDSVKEVRGIKNGMAQEIEEDYRDVTINFLKNNNNIEGGIRLLEKEEWNKRMILWKEQIENGSFEVKNVGLLLKDLYFDEYMPPGENGNLDNLKEVLPKAKKQFAQFYNVPEDEICTGNFSGEECPYSVVLGNFDGRKTLKADKLKIVMGKIDCKQSPLKSMSNLQMVGRSADFSYSQLTDLGNLKTVGGFLDCENSMVSNLSNLVSVGSTARFTNIPAEDLGNLVWVGGAIDCRYSAIRDLGNLKWVRHDAYFNNSKITNLSNLRWLGGSGIFSYCPAEDLSNLMWIGENAYFDNSGAKDLSNLTFVGGHANFSFIFPSESMLTELRNLRAVGKSIDLSDCKITDVRNLRTVGEDVRFGGKIPRIDALEKTGNIYKGRDLITLEETKELAKADQEQSKKTKKPEFAA